MELLLRNSRERVPIGHRIHLKHETVRVLAKRILVWLILVAISLQGVASVTAVLQGPAHYHSASQSPSVYHAAHTSASQHSDHSHKGSKQVRRHYHLPNEGTVLTPVDQPHDVAAIKERSSKGESVSAAFLALIPESLPFYLFNGINSIEIDLTKKLLSSIPWRIERPPRLTRA